MTKEKYNLSQSLLSYLDYQSSACKIVLGSTKTSSRIQPGGLLPGVILGNPFVSAVSKIMAISPLFNSEILLYPAALSNNKRLSFQVLPPSRLLYIFKFVYLHDYHLALHRQGQ